MTKFWTYEVNLFNTFCQLNSISNSKYKYSCLEKKKGKENTTDKHHLRPPSNYSKKYVPKEF